MAASTAEKPSVERTLETIESFFAPAIAHRDNNGFIVEKLAAPAAANDDLIERLLSRASELLHSLHNAVQFEQTASNNAQSYDSTLLLGLYKLLDFLVLEGLFPSLPLGVGLVRERRSKSLFYAKADPEYLPLQSPKLLATILEDTFGPVLDDFGAGLEPLVRHRILSDLVAGNAVLGRIKSGSGFSAHFDVYLQRIPTSTLFQCFMVLLHGSRAEWFRSGISEDLSLLPLRAHGVRSTIDFLAASHGQPQNKDNQNDQMPSKGPAIPLEALNQASTLLSSVPRTMSAEVYFTAIAPQLLQLLDDCTEPALQRAAAFIIGNGILGKRSIGSPGSIGWTLFAAPILATLSPPLPSFSHKRKAVCHDVNTDEIPLVTWVELEQALGRLAMLVLSQPNPGLTGRLIKPLLLPLWALSNFQGTSYAATEASKCAFTLLAQFFRLVGTPPNASLIANNLLCTGHDQWSFVLEQTGAICIKKHRSVSMHLDDEAAIEREFSHIDSRAQRFCRLLATSKMSSGTVWAVFSDLFEQQHSKSHLGDFQQEPSPTSLMRTLAVTKLLRALVESFSEMLISETEQVLRFISRVLQTFKTAQNDMATASAARPSMSTLATIVKRKEDAQAKTEKALDHEDSLIIALSLLNSLTVQADLVQASQAASTVDAIREELKAIERETEASENVSMQIKTTIALLDNALSANYNTSNAANEVDSALDVRRTLALITADIASDLPPIRRSALHALQALIKASDAPLDVPPVAMLLLEVIRTDKEEFVYLAAVQAAVQLALRRNVGYVARLFVGSFQDVDETTGVDGRLRVGEALSSLADGLGDAGSETHVEVIQNMCQSLLAVAGRRGHRQKEQLERQRAERLRRKKNKEAERAWGGEVPDLPVEEELEEYEELSPVDKQKRQLELDAIDAIVKGWENTGFEEDVRIRASALSITGRIFEHCTADLAEPTLKTNTIELCLSVLSLELDPTKAILRRAASLAIFDVLKGVDAQVEAGTPSSTAPLTNGEDWLKVEKVLKWVVDTDPDDLTVGHSENVLEGLEAVRMKILAGAVKSSSEPQDLESHLRGLNVQTPLQTSHDSRSPIKKKAIIEELE